MAKIFLTGDREPLIVENDKAKQIEEDLLNGCLPQTIKIGEMLLTNAPRQIRMVRLDEDNSIKNKENLYEYTTEELKDVIGDWERKRNEAIKKKPNFIDNDALGMVQEGLLDLYIQEEALTKQISDEGKIYYAIIVNEKEGAVNYARIQRQEEALRVLQGKRHFAIQQSQVAV